MPEIPETPLLHISNHTYQSWNYLNYLHCLWRLQIIIIQLSTSQFHTFCAVRLVVSYNFPGELQNKKKAGAKPSIRRPVVESHLSNAHFDRVNCLNKSRRVRVGWQPALNNGPTTKWHGQRRSAISIVYCINASPSIMEVPFYLKTFEPSEWREPVEAGGSGTGVAEAVVAHCRGPLYERTLLNNKLLSFFIQLRHPSGPWILSLIFLPLYVALITNSYLWN